jgi:ABC-2 type transport system permease protein
VTADNVAALPRRPHALRVVWLVSRLALVRKLHRVAAAMSRKKASPGPRGPTAPKRRGGGLGLGFLALLFLFQGTTMSISLVRRVASVAEQRAAGTDVAVVEPSTLSWVDYASEARLQEKSARVSQQEWRTELIRTFEWQARADGLRDPKAIRRRADELAALFERRGDEGFRASANAMWIRTAESSDMLVPLGLVGLLLTTAVVLFGVAGPDQELAKVDSSFEWWFTFPVPAGGLLLARVFETALASPLLWLLLGPFFSVVFWCAGYMWLGIPIGVAATLYVGLLTGSVRVVAETALRRFLSLRAVGRIQAILVLSAYPPMIMALGAVSPEWFKTLSRVAWQLPARLLLSPLNPIRIAAGGRSAFGAAVDCTLFMTVAIACGAGLGGYMIRDGLAKSTGVEGTKRRRAQRAGANASVGVIRKELTLLRRDRTLFVQAIAAPAMVLGVQVVVNPSLFAELASEGRHTAAAAYGVGAFVLATGACNTLALDLPILWIYFTVPRPLERLLVDKALFWAGLATLIAVATFLALTGGRPAAIVAGLPTLLLAAVGIVLSAFIATGIGVLGTDALQTEPRRRLQVAMVYLYMLLASMYAYALYTPSAWAKFTQLVLYTLLVFSLWQKVRDHAPYLLDPAAAPLPSISVADGVIAALAFFVLQGVLALVLLKLDLSPGLSLLLAFVGAGLVVSTSTVFIFWRNGLPNLARQLGLWPADRADWLRSPIVGIVAGLAAAAVARGYVVAIDHVDFLRRLRDEMVALSPEDRQPDMLRWIALLAIFAAPVFEEFIFRAVLYGGFRRSIGPGRAAVASALVFAMVHPAIAFAPVLVLGLAAAWAFERSRFLLAPIMAHMTYNAVVIGVALQ